MTFISTFCLLSCCVCPLFGFTIYNCIRLICVCLTPESMTWRVH